MVSLLFPEYKDDSFSRTFTFLISFAVVLLISFLFLSNQLNFGITTFFLGFSILTILLTFIESDSKDQIIDARYFGNKTNTYIFTIVGLLIGIVLVLIASRNASLAQTIILSQGLTLPNLQFLNQNILAPLTEELFWRGFIVPTSIVICTAIMTSIFGKNTFSLASGFVMGMLLGNLGFGFYHIWVHYDQAGQLLTTYTGLGTAMTMGILFSLAYYFVRSISLPIAWHFINNLYASGFTLEQIIPTAIFFVLIYFIGVEIADRIKPKN